MTTQETDFEPNNQETFVNFVRNKIPDEETIYDLAELFKVFGDSTRTKILSCLEVKDLYVGELAEILNMSISAVSHQLRVLRNAKLVRGTKEGKEVKYALDDNHVMMIIECGLSHLKEDHNHDEHAD
jgi:ArsR family transcriptional regulator